MFQILLDATLFETYRLAASLSQEVQLRTSDDRSTFDFDLVNARRVNWELSLDAFASNDTSHNKHFASTRTALCDNDPTENLDAFFNAFLDFGVDIHCVADAKRIDFLLEGGLLYQLENLLAHIRIDTL